MVKYASSFETFQKGERHHFFSYVVSHKKPKWCISFSLTFLIKKTVKKWNPVQELRCDNRGSTRDDRWWWSFERKTQAAQALTQIQSVNALTQMKLHTSIPEEWM